MTLSRKRTYFLGWLPQIIVIGTSRPPNWRSGQEGPCASPYPGPISLEHLPHPLHCQWPHSNPVGPRPDKGIATFCPGALGLPGIKHRPTKRWNTTISSIITQKIFLPSCSKFTSRDSWIAMEENVSDNSEVSFYKKTSFKFSSSERSCFITALT